MASCSRLKAAFALLPLALAACVPPPPAAPSMAAMPGPGKSADQFAADDGACRQFAMYQTGGLSPSQAATNAGVGTAVGGAALGAGTGAIIGSASGAAGPGAAIGAAAGLLLGSVAGANNAAASGAAVQSRYDQAYMQCMYARGDRVPAPAAPPPGYAYAPAPGQVYYPAPYPYYYRPYRYYAPY